MGTSDGTVIGMTQILDQGPRNRLLNVAIVAEGYQQSELGTFAADAQQFVNGLFTTPPLSDFRRIFNVFRFDVASNQSGADDPATCGDGSTGTGAKVNTYFDASFCSWGIRRLISCDEGLVKGTVGASLPQWHFILLIVNSSQWGGAGGSMAKFSRAGTWVQGAIHEMGHTLFGFADEYDYWADCAVDTDRDDYRNLFFHWEPGEPNITGVTSRSSLKWKDLVLPSTALPTTKNLDCKKCDPQLSPVPAGTVGLFEGAGYFHCGLLRPQYKCKMRDTADPFCAVCSRRIGQKFAPYWSYVTSQPLAVSVQPGLLPPGKPTAVTVEVTDGYTGADVTATLEVNGQQVGQSNTPFTFTLTGGAVQGTVTAPDYPATSFWLRPAPLPMLQVSVIPAAIPYGLPTTVVVHAQDAQTGATVAGSVKVDSSTVGSTDTPFNRTFSLRIVPEFDPESKTWLSTKVDPAGWVSAAGYSDTLIPFLFYAPELSVSVQPPNLVVGSATQVIVTATDGFTSASVSGSVRIGGQLVGTTGTPFSYTLAGSTAYGTVQATGYPSAPFSIQSVPPPRLRVWTTPFPVPEGNPVQLTVHAVDDATNAAVSGAVKVDGQQVALTNTAFSYTLIRPPPEFDPESKSWFTSALPEGSVSAAGFPETVFKWK